MVILNVSGEDKIPLSLPQEQMLIMDQMYPNLGTYNVFNVIRLNNSLNLKALQDSFSLLVQRHQILRTIVVQEEQYWQKVQDHCDFEWEEFDFVDKHKTKQAFEEDSISIMREKAREPFNLYQVLCFECTFSTVLQKKVYYYWFYHILLPMDGQWELLVKRFQNFMIYYVNQSNQILFH